METAVIKIEGMSCEHCVKAVKDAVSAVSGVYSVDVNLSVGTASVEYEAGKVSLAEIGEAIENQGFDVIA